MNRCRERWVHQHDTGHDAGIQVVVDVRGVKPGCGDGGKKLREDAGTALGKFVENERGAGEFSKDGKKAGAGRRFQNDVGGQTLTMYDSIAHVSLEDARDSSSVIATTTPHDRRWVRIKRPVVMVGG